MSSIQRVKFAQINIDELYTPFGPLSPRHCVGGDATWYCSCLPSRFDLTVADGSARVRGTTAAEAASRQRVVWE